MSLSISRRHAEVERLAPRGLTGSFSNPLVYPSQTWPGLAAGRGSEPAIEGRGAEPAGACDQRVRHEGLSDQPRAALLWSNVGGEQATYTTSDLLIGDVDMKAAEDWYKENFQVKGFFLTPLAHQLAECWSEIEPQLMAPPSRGRYVAFKNYPQLDHFRMTVAVASKRFPRFGTREGVRRKARDDIAVFGTTTVGRVMLAVVGSAKSSLMRVPEAYRLVATGIRVDALDMGEVVELTFRNHRGGWEYTLGQIEGVALHYGCTPRTTVAQPRRGILTLRVELSA